MAGIGRCAVCGTNIKQVVIKNYLTDLLGIPVRLINSVREDSCLCADSSPRITIPDIDGLIATAAVARAKHALGLNGAEIRFMRKAMGLGGKELGELLNVAKETVSRWENDKEPIGSASEKLLRIVVGLKLKADAPAIAFDPTEIVEMKVQTLRQAGQKVVMEFHRGRMKTEKKELWNETDREAA